MSPCTDKQRRVPVGSKSSPTPPPPPPPPPPHTHPPHNAGPSATAARAPSPSISLPDEEDTLMNVDGGGEGGGGGGVSLKDHSQAVGKDHRDDDQVAPRQQEQQQEQQHQHQKHRISILEAELHHANAELHALRSDLEACELALAAERTERDRLRRDLKSRDEDARSLLAQIRGLKEWVSTSTRSRGQVSDEVFAEAVAKLANGLQNWVITNFRRTRLDSTGACAETRRELARLVPRYEDEVLAKSAKVHLLQSVLSGVLLEMVFGVYYVGLADDQVARFAEAERVLLSLTSSREAVNHWRATTLGMLARDASQAALRPTTDQAIDEIVARSKHLLDAIAHPLSSPPSTNATVDWRALRSLVVGAVDLARQLSSQRAEFELTVPLVEHCLSPSPSPSSSSSRSKDEASHPRRGAPFDPRTMEDVGCGGREEGGEEGAIWGVHGGEEDGDDKNEGNGGGDSATAGREVCCVVFPGLVKRGDETGGQLHFENVIAKARVLLDP